MRIPSDDEVELAFAQYCLRDPGPSDGDMLVPSGGAPSADKEWFIGSSYILRTSAEARQIVRACLALDVVVSDRLDSAAWVGVLGGVLDLMERVEKLEAGR